MARHRPTSGLVLLLFLLLTGILGSRAASAELPPRLISFTQERSAFRASILQLLERQDFDRLEELATELRQTRQRFSSGTQKLLDFYAALAPSSRFPQLSTRKQYYDLLSRWLAFKPNSITPRLGLAGLYQLYAWQFRGTGPASTVTKDGWEGYRMHSEWALRYLQEALAIRTDDPATYELMIMVHRDLGSPRVVIEDTFRDGTKTDLTYDHLYIAMANYLLPRWYGSPREFEAFASRAADDTRALMGERMYVRVAIVGQFTERDQFRRIYNFSWQRLKKGFAELDRDFPNSSWTLNFYAWFACHYEDRPTAQEVLRRLENHWDDDAADAWGDRSNFDKCRQWAFTLM